VLFRGLSAFHLRHRRFWLKRLTRRFSTSIDVFPDQVVFCSWDDGSISLPPVQFLARRFQK